jgi:thioredoxin reductase
VITLADINVIIAGAGTAGIIAVLKTVIRQEKKIAVIEQRLANLGCTDHERRIRRLEEHTRCSNFAPEWLCL